MDPAGHPSPLGANPPIGPPICHRMWPSQIRARLLPTDVRMGPQSAAGIGMLWTESTTNAQFHGPIRVESAQQQEQGEWQREWHQKWCLWKSGREWDENGGKWQEWHRGEWKCCKEWICESPASGEAHWSLTANIEIIFDL